MITEYSICELLLAGTTLSANHRHIEACRVVALYGDGQGMLEYWLKGSWARQVRLPRGTQGILDAMATVADWEDWDVGH
jgi:hypothetical protein